MTEEKEKPADWLTLGFVFLGLAVAFFYGGIWVGLTVLVFGTVALGWNKRHEGPFPTNKHKP